ncbi:MAG: sigma-54-dependent Fis family transcriptional regulator [Spirochaetales bacterium]|nr:sigma-54-dependent Fis family transcriptional regulator [Spirochaetales bacterium]
MEDGKDISIIVVDDESIILESIKDYFDYLSITIFSNPVKALEAFKKQYFDIAVVDYKMQTMNGLELLINAKKMKSYGYGILLTAYANKKLLEQFINKSLIQHVMEKPLSLDSLETIFNRAIKICREKKDQPDYKALYRDLRDTINIQSKNRLFLDPKLDEYFGNFRKISYSDANILITGETGTGKNVLAMLIHEMSRRADKPFVKIDCAALPGQLIESELFGYEKGAFTGADQSKPGKIELSNDGTLFLDEIGELDLRLQIKLLKVLQEKEVERLGSNKTKPIDFRLITATNKNLQQLLDRNQFRVDLYYRINTFHLPVPPLRNRKELLRQLIFHFTKLFSEEMYHKDIDISDEALSLLLHYTWPGNIRELENAIKRSLILVDEEAEKLEPGDFNFLFNIKPHNEDIFHSIAEYIIREKKSLKDIEKPILKQIITHFNGDISTAVQNTSISKNTFYRNR